MGFLLWGGLHAVGWGGSSGALLCCSGCAGAVVRRVWIANVKATGVTASCCLGREVQGALPRGTPGAALCWAQQCLGHPFSACSQLQPRGKPRIYQLASPASVGVSSSHCSSKHLQIHLHTQRLFTPGSGHGFTCGLWSEGYGMIGVLMGLLGSTTVPAVVQDRPSAKGDAPAPGPKL